MAAQSYRKVVSSTLTTNFREACQIVHAQIPKLGNGEVLIKNRFVGINATDVNVAAGRYSTGQKPPLDTGLEGVGKIVAVGENVSPELNGRAVGYIFNGAFGEYVENKKPSVLMHRPRKLGVYCEDLGLYIFLYNTKLKLPFKAALPLPAEKADYVPLLISGLTAEIALERLGELKPKENVLITAAAGGTGHLAVQIAKNNGCHVIGLCSTSDKATFLKGLGCDRVINYKEEKLNDVLKKEYARGIDVAYESIGGEVFETCLNRIAVGGRIISLGFISSYHSPGGVDRSVKHATILQKLLLKSAGVRGFFLLNHAKDYKTYLPKLIEMTNKGELKPHIELFSSHGSKGLETIFDAVDHLYSRSSKGKIVVDLGESHYANL